MKVLFVVMTLYVGSLDPEIDSWVWPNGMPACEQEVATLKPLYEAAEGDTGTDGRVISKMVATCYLQRLSESPDDVIRNVRQKL
jgi:hypothetical protein